MIVAEHTVVVTTFDGDDLEWDPTEPTTITADRGWTPHVQGTIAIKTPATPADVEPGRRLIVHQLERTGDISFLSDLDTYLAGGTTAGFDALLASGTTTAVFDDLIDAGNWCTPPRAATSRRSDLIITSSTRSRDRTLLTVQSDEVRWQDALWFDLDESSSTFHNPQTIIATTAVQMVEQAFAGQQAIILESAIANYLPYNPGLPDVVMLATDRSFTETTFEITPGERIFGPIEERFALLQQRLYSPGDGTVLVRDYPWAFDHELTISDAVGNLIDWELAASHGPFFMMKFAGTLTDPDAEPIYSEFAFPELQPPHTELVDIATPYPGTPEGLFPGTWSPMQPYVNRLRLLASTSSVKAVNDYTAMPGTSVEVTLPGEDPFTFSVDSVTWQIGDRWQMTITF